MEPTPRLDHLVIAVSDWDRSNRFYREVVGVEIAELPRGRTAYGLDNAQLNVHGPDSSAEPLPAQPVRAGNSDLCLEWPGPITEAADHLASHGVEIVEGPVERQGSRGPGMSIYFRDPDGSLLEFISYA